MNIVTNEKLYLQLIDAYKSAFPEKIGKKSLGAGVLLDSVTYGLGGVMKILWPTWNEGGWVFKKVQKSVTYHVNDPWVKIIIQNTVKNTEEIRSLKVIRRLA